MVQHCLLAGDIGATKTSMALYPQGRELTEHLAVTTVNNDTAANFEEIVETLLRDTDTQPEGFMASFAKGKYREMLASIPVHVILNPKTALIGAAAYGREHPVASRDRV